MLSSLLLSAGALLSLLVMIRCCIVVVRVWLCAVDAVLRPVLLLFVVAVRCLLFAVTCVCYCCRWLPGVVFAVYCC